MRKRELLETVEIPNSRSKMSLYQQGDEFSIWVDGVPLMTSRKHGSEEALADLGCAKLRDRADGHILVGGLGMGFTLAATLRSVGPQASIRVAELVPAILTWNQTLLGHFAAHPLEDARVEVQLADVADILRASPNTWDAILLDVDNGPSGMTQDKNTWLYWPDGLRVIHKALTAQGVVSIWSAYSDPAFQKRLIQAGFKVELHPVAAHGKGGSTHYIWTARKKN
jgi:spermidine synthase